MNARARKPAKTAPTESVFRLPDRFITVTIDEVRFSELMGGGTAIIDMEDRTPRPGTLWQIEYPESNGPGDSRRPAYRKFIKCTKEIDPSWYRSFKRSGPEWHISFGAGLMHVGQRDGTFQPQVTQYGDFMTDEMFRERIIGRVVAVVSSQQRAA